MKAIKQGSKKAAVEDVQQRLALLGLLPAEGVDGVFGDVTVSAVRAFCQAFGLDVRDEVDEEVWQELVDASYSLGDRTLYLRMPNFQGHDVEELQQALGALGFLIGGEDGVFGAHTEDALRKFQMNLGLPSDGIAGAYTFTALRNLQHSWAGKGSLSQGRRHLGFARAADVLEENALCLFGMTDFTRSVASRMSNLALATNPASRIVSADSLSVEPDASMVLVQIAMKAEGDGVPTVTYIDDDSLSVRLSGALQSAHSMEPVRIRIVVPGESWDGAGEDRSAQHFAITLLDALCAAL
ncbi:MAG: peptidoglycan-binding protein [Eggerthellaceae bacterium]|nr:peptidoglycan-binding protein [Eggerthellaceae bacterium]